MSQSQSQERGAYLVLAQECYSVDQVCAVFFDREAALSAAASLEDEDRQSYRGRSFVVQFWLDGELPDDPYYKESLHTCGCRGAGRDFTYCSAHSTR